MIGNRTIRVKQVRTQVRTDNHKILQLLGKAAQKIIEWKLIYEFA